MSAACCAEAPVADLQAGSCVRCGALLRRTNRGRLCLPCDRSATVHASWSPRCDPTFGTQWLTYLILHAGEWVHPSDVWRSRDERQRLQIRQLASEVVAAAERVGVLVEHDQWLGYRLMGMTDPPKYLRKGEAEEAGEMPGQLTLTEDGGVL